MTDNQGVTLTKKNYPIVIKLPIIFFKNTEGVLRVEAPPQYF